MGCEERKSEDDCGSLGPALIYNPYFDQEGYECRVGECVWNNEQSNCQPPYCGLYTSQDTCCANARNVPSGCYWMAHSDPEGSGHCSPMICSHMDESTCASVTGCKVECDACSPEHFTDCDCSRDESHKRCEAPRQDLGLLQMLDCPAMSCTMCLKGLGGAGLGLGSSGLSLDEGKVKELYTGECNANCTDIAQCEAEAVCLMSNPGPDPDYVEFHKAERCKVMPSCASEITTSTTTGMECAEVCDEFDMSCDECGGEAPCGSSSDARRAGLCLMDYVGGSFMLSVLGTILFVHTD